MLTLPRSPTPHEEYAHDWWVKRFGDRTCDWCEGQIRLDDIYTANSGYGPLAEGNAFCSEQCYEIHREYQQRITDESGQLTGRKVA